MTENWRPVLGWEGRYSVSDAGRVRSETGWYLARRKGVLTKVKKRGRILTPFLTSGYPSVALCKDGSQRTSYIHRLVCEAWHGPAPEGCEVAHNDGDRANNNPVNLRWATRVENLRDKVRHGRQPRGDDLKFTKVTDEVVRQIRRDQTTTSAEWARTLNVSHALIRNIRLGKRRIHAGAL